MAIRAGIIGLGQIGNLYDLDPLRNDISTHAGAYENHPDFDLVAGADQDGKKKDTFLEMRPGTRGYEDYKEMLLNEKLDIVSICTPPETHLEIIREVLNSGIKYIFCEKPLAGSLEEAREVLQLADYYTEAVIGVNMVRRWDQALIKAREFILHGELGAIKSMDVYYGKGIYNAGSHIFDLLLWFFGEIEHIQAFESGLSFKKNDPAPDIYLKFKSGIRCIFHAIDPRDFLKLEICIIGSMGILEMKDSLGEFSLLRPGEHPRFSGHLALNPVPQPFGEGLRNLMENAIKNLRDVILEGDSINCTVSDGFNSLLVSEAAARSLKEEKRIYIDQLK